MRESNVVFAIIVLLNTRHVFLLLKCKIIYPYFNFVDSCQGGASLWNIPQ